MKQAAIRNLSILLLLSISMSSFSQKAEPVYSIVRQIHNFEWYEQQSKAWKHEIDSRTSDNMAWVYYYRANRMARMFQNNLANKEKVMNLIPLKEIIAMAEKAIPNTFELNYLEAYENGTYTEIGEKNLLKAQEIKPYDKILLPDLMTYYELNRDTLNSELVSKKWFESNEMPQEILITAYNNLVSLEKNAILITYGDNDTYPYWILQKTQKLRPDVMILNISLALINPYRNKLFNENNIPELNFKDEFEKSSEKIIKYLFDNIHNKSIYVSIFADQNIYKDYSDKMYLTGLSYKYSDKPFDNLAVLRNNVENKFMLDFLKRNFYNNYAQSAVNQMNIGYLAIFLKLHEHYLLGGEVKKAEKLKELAKVISENSGNTEWLKYFEK